MGGTSSAAGLASATPTLSRRRLLRNTAIGTAVAGSGIAASLLGATSAAATAGDPATFVPADPNLHLLRRATWGPTPTLLTHIKGMGAAAWLEEQLNPGAIDDSGCAAIVAAKFPLLRTTMADAYQSSDNSWQRMEQIGLAAITRAAWSRRQLYEVMVDFWSNHLNVTNFGDNVWWSRHDYDRVVIRKHALGKFSDMLVAAAQHPAMLMYLNNAESTGQNPNENYGRELLELHTVGVDAGYSEDEMRSSALTLTGFSISWDTGLFEYHADDHYTGHVSILGWSSPNTKANGQKVGLSYLDYLAHHPSTAHHIALKLGQRFVSDTPPPKLVSGLAKAYLANDTAIAPVLRTLFRSKTFAESIGQKVRRPMQDVIATLRILGIQLDAGDGIGGAQNLEWTIDGMSDLPYGWVAPNGYPDVAGAWRSAGSTLNRWNAHLALAAGWSDDLRLPDLRSHLLPARLPATHGELVQALAQRLVFRKLAAAHRDAILGFLGKTASDPLHAGDAAVDWRLPYVVALILDSPYHGIR